MDREQIFNAERADKREQVSPLYVSRTMRPRYDALVVALGYKSTRPGQLLKDMIEFFEKTTPEERRSLLNAE